MRFLLLTLTNFLFLNATILAQSKLELVLSALEQDADLQYASFGFCAIDIDDNKVVAQRNPNMSLIPASSLKVITTSTALGILGADYKFKTELQYDGTIVKGVLQGNLYIKGYGDPCLGSPVMEGVVGMDTLLAQWALVLKRAGIQRIEGSIIGDGTYFEDLTVVPTWQWADVGNYYGAGVSGLNLNDNMYTVFLQQNSKIGATPTITEITPEIPNLKMTNELQIAPANTGDNAYIFLAPYAHDAAARGTIPAGSGLFKIKGSIPDPSLFAAHSFHKVLQTKGISVSKPPQTQRNLDKLTERRTIHTHLSPTLLEIVKHTNEDSRNMYCEAMVKMMGAKKKNLATLEAGLLAVSEFWTERGVDMKGFFVMDGSGLSARNAVSTRAFAQIMRKIYLDKTTFANFYDLLAIAGKTGTLASIGRGSAASNNIRAKSGSIGRVRSYTGYVTTRSGKMLAFSMIVNNYSCTGSVMRKKLEEIMIQMAELR